MLLNVYLWATFFKSRRDSSSAIRLFSSSTEAIILKAKSNIYITYLIVNFSTPQVVPSVEGKEQHQKLDGTSEHVRTHKGLHTLYKQGIASILGAP